METNKYKILIIDDEPMNIKVLSSLLPKNHYKIMALTEGKKAFDLIKKGSTPDLILLDIVMPEMDGYELCKALKKDEATKDIPVIFISSMNNIEDEEKGLSMGAVDYITKPFIPSVVLARVNTHIKLSRSLSELKRLYSMALDSNPLTGLPGNNSISKQIEKILSRNERMCVLYIDLDHFKEYNDKYGFAMGDKVLLETSSILKEVVEKLEISRSFIGHIGGDDFVVIIPSDFYELYIVKLIETFDKNIKTFYSEKDRKAGSFLMQNRYGEMEEFSFVSLSIACVDLKNSRFINYLEVNDACAAAKMEAKKIKGSSYYISNT